MLVPGGAEFARNQICKKGIKIARKRKFKKSPTIRICVNLQKIEFARKKISKEREGVKFGRNAYAYSLNGLLSITVPYRRHYLAYTPVPIGHISRESDFILFLTFEIKRI